MSLRGVPHLYSYDGMRGWTSREPLRLSLPPAGRASLLSFFVHAALLPEAPSTPFSASDFAVSGTCSSSCCLCSLGQADPPAPGQAAPGCCSGVSCCSFLFLHRPPALPSLCYQDLSESPAYSPWE